MGLRSVEIKGPSSRTAEAPARGNEDVFLARNPILPCSDSHVSKCACYVMQSWLQVDLSGRGMIRFPLPDRSCYERSVRSSSTICSVSRFCQTEAADCTPIKRLSMSDAALPAADAGQSAAVPPVSKRKWLDSIASLDAATRADPLTLGGGAKKRRTRQACTFELACQCEVAHPSICRTPHNTSTPALEAILARTARPSRPSEALPPATYQPTSLPALLERIATYRLTTFSPSKPPSLSALSCALHGWIHTPSTRERVQCVTCGHGVVLLPPTVGDSAWSSPAGQRLRQEYERQVSGQGQAHAEACPWKLRPCARSLYRLPGGGLGVSSGGRRRLLEELGREAAALDQNGLGQVALTLPEPAREVLESDERRARLVKAVALVADPAPGDESPSISTTDSPSATSILLGIFGWNLLAPPAGRPSSSSTSPSLARSNSASSISSLTETGGSPILACKYCTRHVLASSYLSSSGSSTGGGASGKRFDPVQQHQAFCPFVSSASAADTQATGDAAAERGIRADDDNKTTTSRKPGWLVRLEAVLPRQSAPLTESREGASHSKTTSHGNVSCAISPLSPWRSKRRVAEVRLAPLPLFADARPAFVRTQAARSENRASFSSPPRAHSQGSVDKHPAISFCCSERDDCNTCEVRWLVVGLGF